MSAKEKNITVALSGGADSVALLSSLLELKDELGLIVSAAHLNHGLRGEESDRDEAFVKELCKSLSVALVTEKADVMSRVRTTGESVELAARNVRYDFLYRVSKGLIATAHTANDNAETVLFNMSRGTGIAGMCGIPPVRDNIIRPLTFVTRSEIEDYLTLKGLSFVTDSTNLCDDAARNKLRHHAVPVLMQVNERAVENTAAMSERLRVDADYLNSAADTAFAETFERGGLNTDKLKALHKALKTRCISRLFEAETGHILESSHVESVIEMLCNGERRRSVSFGFSAEIRRGILYFSAPIVKDDALSVTVDSFPFEYGKLKLFKENPQNIKKCLKINNLLFKNTLNCDKIYGVLVLRHRKPGDSIRLCGRNVTKSFKKLFNEQGLSESERNSLLVLSDDRGVVWLENFGVDERVSASDAENVIVISNES